MLYQKSWWIYPLVNLATYNYGKIHHAFLIAKSTIFMVIYQRVSSINPIHIP